ncbi:hypothetical protein CCACVL1_00618 [Corchorus capsularis]|uniref:Uncharacterized protein n=1 Tax=Corchorus capsularis TaxID=210143 RepID=A0A1R3KVX5_COCAP|nr:hypothetical protein CCACVL1_00618 [Corchorus capsularis]
MGRMAISFPEFIKSKQDNSYVIMATNDFSFHLTANIIKIKACISKDHLARLLGDPYREGRNHPWRNIAK